jgi:hypothetical protein
MVVKSGYARRRNARGAGRPMEELPHGQTLALHRTRSPSRPCGSVQGGYPCCPRGGVPLPHHAAMAANPGGAQGRRNGPIAPTFLVMRGSQDGPLFASSRWPLQTE